MRLMSLAIGLLMGLAMAETLIRLFKLAAPLQPAMHNFVPDAYLPFKPGPFSRDTGRNEEFAYDYRHNSLGLRDEEHPIERPEGGFLVLGLGDSFTYGVGAGREETYLALLETRLNGRQEQHRRIEVINAGVPRYFPEAERVMLERYGLPFRPDLVLVGVLPNDVVDTYLGIDAVTADSTGYLRTREARELGEWGTRLYRYSHLGRLVLRRYIDWRLQPRMEEIFVDGGFHERDWLKMEEEFGKMAGLAGSIGAELVLVHIPQKGPWGASHEYLPDRLSAWASRNNVHFVDVLPAMQRHPAPERLYYPRDGHCTPEGYAVVADELFRYLTSRRLVP